MHAVMGTGRLIAGRYRLHGPVGRGAMGIVWRGRDELLARDVAVKEVQITAHASPADAETIYQRTLLEARTAARLTHPSVVKVFDVVEENGSPWIIMELVEARSLDRVITEDGPLPPLAAAELGASLISALSSAHSAGVLHRDVKPSNVLVTGDGKAVLTDFGIATFAGDPSMTQAGMVVGTPGFTAPERVRGDAATPASDLWSLGATLYAAVEGRGPFDRLGGSAVITAGVASEDAPRAPSAGPLGPVIDALLSRDPGTRPDATTAANLLAEAAAEARTGPRPLVDGWLAADPSTAGQAAGARDPASHEAAGWTAAGWTAGGAEADTDAGRNGAAFTAHAEGEAAVRSDADEPGAGEDADARPADFLDPPAFAELSMPDFTGPGKALSSTDRLPGTDQRSPGLAGAAAGVVLGAGLAGAGLAGAQSPAGAAGAAPGADAEPGAASGPQPILGSDGGPVLWEPFKPASGGTQGGTTASWQAGPGGADGAGGPGGPGGGNGGRRFWRRNGPSKPTSGRWRLMVAGAGIAAIVIAAVIGWGIYTHTQSQDALQNRLPGASGYGGSSQAGPGASGSVGPGRSHGGSPAAGKSGATTASRGHSPGVGKPSARPSGKVTSPGSTPSTHPSGSASPTPSPSPSPTPSTSTGPPVLPSGYVWHQFSAAVMGSTAGFKIGLPSPWTQSVAGLVAHLNQPARSFHLTVSVGLWTYVKPLAQAQYLQREAAAAYSGYTELSLGAVGFEAIGGFRAVPAAQLKFSWRTPADGRFTELVVLVTLSTKSGDQPYTFRLWAPSSTFGAADGVFHTALTTFRPLPA